MEKLPCRSLLHDLLPAPQRRRQDPSVRLMVRLWHAGRIRSVCRRTGPERPCPQKRPRPARAPPPRGPGAGPGPGHRVAATQLHEPGGS